MFCIWQFLSQALAKPTIEESQSVAENVVQPKNEIVDAFRDEINRQFVRYQNFYTLTNAAMSNYRLLHVALVSQVYNALMTIFGDRIEEVRVAAYELNDLIDAKYEQLGQVNTCLSGVMDARNQNSAAVGEKIQACALYANTTLSGLLLNTFYPTFATVQDETSSIPISVIDVLSRGNVLEDEQAIIVYLNERYAVFELQWLGMVSQLLRWETNRFENEGLFLNDQSAICLGDATWEYLLTNSRLEGDVAAC